MLKFLIVWLMTLVLPMQGFATVNVMRCEMPHAQQMLKTTHGHCHAHQVSVTHKHTHPAQGESKQACQHCAKCAACCTSVTLLSPTTPSVDVPRLAGSGLYYLSPMFSSYISSGLERPPRSPLTSAIPG